jgi:hypothetical protein
MAKHEAFDNVIRTALRTEVHSEEPSATIRESLLSAAAADNTLRSVVGPAVPPLMDDLYDQKESNVADWSMPVMTAIPLPRRQLLMLAAPMYAVR